MGLAGIAMFAQGPGARIEGEAIFHKHVRPMLEEKCAGCHGKAQAISQFRATAREDLLKGGNRGPSLVPGDAKSGTLLLALEQTTALKMPPGAKLPEETIAAVRRWVELGAPWPEGPAPAAAAQGSDADAWAFGPLRPGKLTSIDAYLQAELAKAKLPLAARASRRELIRRATQDVWGLPPTPEQVEAFVRDARPDAVAWKDLVDRLLASPRYGERWARHWLDVTRYADTGGFSNDYERPNAWRYREYVIRSLNNDKPYFQFVREQIAGDEMDASNPEMLVATGFLRMGPWEHTGMSVAAVTRQQWLDDVTHSTTATFLGLTMECARCHDHKFDPIPTKEYYRVQAVFAASEFAEPAAKFLPGEARDDFAAGRKRLEDLMQRNEARVKEYELLCLNRAAQKRGLTGPSEIPDKEARMIRQNKRELTPEEFERFKVYQKRQQLYKESIKRYEELAYGLQHAKKAQDVHILPVGNLETPGERVDPGYLSAVWRGPQAGPADVTTEIAGRRRELAEWIGSEKNPLTARVIVNRVWHWHFGHGIVRTPNDFGKLGARPTHPELLDWLAAEFVANQGSIKHLHRMILSSEAYQRGSQPADAELVKKADLDNKLLSYFPPRRMEAEEIRDSMLAVSGELSLETGGPGVFAAINRDIAQQPQQIMGTLRPAWEPAAKRADRNRRTIYTFQMRNLVDPMLEVLNAASMNESTAKRDETTIPTQAYALFNSDFARAQALALAQRAGNIDGVWRRILLRAPTAAEKTLAASHLAKRTEWHKQHAPPARGERKALVRAITSELTGDEVMITEDIDPLPYEENLHPGDVAPGVRALADIALALLNSSEFLYPY